MSEMSLEEIFASEDQHTSGLYAKHRIVIVKGSGAVLWDQNGREYIDCMAGHGVANLGHAHPEVARALSAQACRLITLPETFYNDQRAALVKVMSGLVPGLERVFFCNSGAEAVEAAVKFARLSTGRKGLVAAMRGFHGRTLGALSATWNKAYREPFEPLVPGFSHIPYNNLDTLEEAVNEETAAVLLEVVQGEGGVHPAEPAFVQTAQRLCQERGALLIVDEIQTGLGRTGRMLALEHYALQPDMVCLAKSIAGGLPMGAVLIGPRVQNLSPGMHGSTFGGNPLACAAALAVLTTLEREDLPRQAAEKGDFLMEGLRAMTSPLVREVRGLGLMVGIELKKKVAPYLQAMEERGVLALPAGMTVIRLLPPLVIRPEQLARVLSVLTEVLA
jgi:acetylornithine/LysW-gamma-L-lysine aminotransferase